MTIEKRTPAFWRVVNVTCGKKTYRAEGGWAANVSQATSFITDEEAKPYCTTPYGKTRIVPVYHRVVKKPKGHGIGWAVARLKEGKRVRRRGWGAVSCYVQMVAGVMNFAGPNASGFFPSDVMSRDWELAE